MKWLSFLAPVFELITRAWAFIVTWLWANQIANSRIEKSNAEQDRKDGQKWANARNEPTPDKLRRLAKKRGD